MFSAHSKSRWLFATMLGLAAWSAGPINAQDPIQGDPNAGNQPPPDGVEAMTRGPVHEAFARPVVFNPKPGGVATKAPPATVEEIPPDQKPEGDIIWVSGYWAWEEERQDFLWISGIWRDPPPGMTWVPGYWSEVDGGYQWTAGYWQSAETQEVDYLPQPPQSLESGPNVPQPDDNHFWVPGNYVWRETRYYWQPGYWTGHHNGWVWIPARYYWTPIGFVYTAGYWDVPLETRGVIFAPVVFTVARPVYTPTIVLNIGVVTNHLFCRPHHHAYVFGDYYDDVYINAGYTPWWQFGRTRFGCDPNFTYYSLAFGRTHPRWSATLRANFELVRRDRDFRPPRTFVQQTNIVNNITNVNNTTVVNNVINNTVGNINATNIQNNPIGRIGSVSMASNFNRAVQQNAFKNFDMKPIDANRRREITQRADSMRQASQQRRTLELAQVQRIQPAGANLKGASALRNPNATVAAKQPVKVKLDERIVNNLNANASKTRIERPANQGVGAGVQGNVGAGAGANVNRDTRPQTKTGPGMKTGDNQPGGVAGGRPNLPGGTPGTQPGGNTGAIAGSGRPNVGKDGRPTMPSTSKGIPGTQPGTTGLPGGTGGNANPGGRPNMPSGRPSIPGAGSGATGNQKGAGSGVPPGGRVIPNQPGAGSSGSGRNIPGAGSQGSGGNRPPNPGSGGAGSGNMPPGRNLPAAGGQGSGGNRPPGSGDGTGNLPPRRPPPPPSKEKDKEKGGGSSANLTPPTAGHPNADAVRQAQIAEQRRQMAERRSDQQQAGQQQPAQQQAAQRAAQQQQAMEAQRRAAQQQAGQQRAAQQAAEQRQAMESQRQAAQQQEAARRAAEQEAARRAAEAQRQQQQ